jgi:hypothetical protein
MKNWLPDEYACKWIRKAYETDGFIPAIKVYRDYTNMGLLFAKDAVQMLASDYGWLDPSESQLPWIRVSAVDALALVGLPLHVALGRLAQRMGPFGQRSHNRVVDWLGKRIPRVRSERACMQNMAEQLGFDSLEVRRLLLKRYPDPGDALKRGW